MGRFMPKSQTKMSTEGGKACAMQKDAQNSKAGTRADGRTLIINHLSSWRNERSLLPDVSFSEGSKKYRFLYDISGQVIHMYNTVPAKISIEFWETHLRKHIHSQEFLTSIITTHTQFLAKLFIKHLKTISKNLTDCHIAECKLFLT